MKDEPRTIVFTLPRDRAALVIGTVRTMSDKTGSPMLAELDAELSEQMLASASSGGVRLLRFEKRLRRRRFAFIALVSCLLLAMGFAVGHAVATLRFQ